jgi:hypothetical protein
MKKAFKIILWIVLILIAVFFILAYIGMKYGPHEPVSETSDCTKIYASYDASNPGEDLAKDACYSDLAIKNNDITYCSKIGNAENKTRCEVLFNDTPIGCKGLNDSEVCYVGYAMLHKDPTVCELPTIPQRKVDCYKEVAIVLNDPAICNKIPSLDYYSEAAVYTCQAITKNDPSICEKAKHEIYGTINVDGCYYSMSVAKNDFSYCAKIRDQYQRSFCENRTKGVLVSPGFIGQ